MDIKILFGNSDNKLPRNGWIHLCYFCNIPTSRLFICKVINELYKIYFCKDCHKHILKSRKISIIRRIDIS
jgi:hypothetical protein